MVKDIRFFLLQLVNDVREKHGLPALLLHEDESRNCKAHAEHMAGLEQAVGAPAGHYEPRGWTEHVRVAEGEGAPHEILEREFLPLFLLGRTHPVLRKMLEAREFLASDVAVHSPRRSGKREVYVCMRFK